MKLPPEDISYQVKANVINTKYLCEPFNWSIGPIFDITMIITQANGLTVALLKYKHRYTNDSKRFDLLKPIHK